MTNWVAMIFGMMKHGINPNMPTKPTLYFVKNVVLSELFQESFNYEEFQQQDTLGFVYWIVIIFGKNVH
jgi:hypothetical protein